MDMATRQERKDILRQIDKLEIGRCGDCAGYTAYHIAVKCNCTSAAGIRKLGDALIATTNKTRKNRIDDYIEQAKKSGLTPELYRNLREHGVDIRQMRRLIGWTVKQITEWRREHNLYEEAVTEAPVVEKRKGNIAEQRGLTLEDYLNAKKIGFLDREIRRKYNLSQFAMLDFKKRHGLALPRGHNSKYAHNNTNKREKVQV